jgi:UDP-galactopyranose mutase
VSLEISVLTGAHIPAPDIAGTAAPDGRRPLPVICFSHLRWDFVYQRPQHLLSRAAQSGSKVFFWEEPIFSNIPQPVLTAESRGSGDGSGQGSGGGFGHGSGAGSVTVLRPILPHGLGDAAINHAQHTLLQDFLVQQRLEEFLAWYYTPMALAFTAQLQPAVVVYDCMDELSAFDSAPPLLGHYEGQLLRQADLVFAGGRSLYESKLPVYPGVQLLPSSIDRSHFERARLATLDPEDQRSIAHPRVGFFGVLDERLDGSLLRDVAALRPQMQFVMLGPTVKIRPEDLPSAPNLHYLGQKSYADLPAYIAGWDAAILPFAQNASTTFISPTKTPEYLAAGRRVVSTPIRDVVRDYGDPGLVAIASNPSAFAAALDLAVKPPSVEWYSAVDAKLAQTSWDATWRTMWASIDRVVERKQGSGAGGARCEGAAGDKAT